MSRCVNPNTTYIEDYYISSNKSANTFANEIESGNVGLLADVLIQIFGGIAHSYAITVASSIMLIDGVQKSRIVKDMRDEVITNDRAINLTITSKNSILNSSNIYELMIGVDLFIYI